MIIDGGPVGIGLESTIVDVSGPVPTVLRPGAVTMEMLEDTLGKVAIDPAILGPMAEGERPKAPGMKYKHYAPKADLTLVEPSGTQTDAMTAEVRRLALEAGKAGRRVGIICTDESRQCYADVAGALIRSIGSRREPSSVAHNLYRVLREFDDLEADCIFSESFPQDHLGQAIMNRLSKAAAYHIVRV